MLGKAADIVTGGKKGITEGAEGTNKALGKVEDIAGKAPSGSGKVTGEAVDEGTKTAKGVGRTKQTAGSSAGGSAPSTTKVPKQEVIGAGRSKFAKQALINAEMRDFDLAEGWLNAGRRSGLEKQIPSCTLSATNEPENY